MALILIIDDDNSLLSMMDLMLTRAGYDTILVNNGEDGIRVAYQDSPDLAIVDIMMPDMDGYEVCRSLRSSTQTEHIPLLILTALSQFDAREQAEKAGADAFVTKPITRGDLVNHVKDLLVSGPVNKPNPIADTDEDIDPPLVFEEAPPPEPVQSDYMPSSEFSAPQFGYPFVTVMGLSNGIGATSFAVNLAYSLKQHIDRTCLVDLNEYNGHVAGQLQLDPALASWQHLIGIRPGADKNLIGQALNLTHKSGLALMLAPPRMGTGQLSMTQLDGSSLGYIIEVLSEGFQRIVADLPPNLNALSIHTLKMAKDVILVVGDNPATLPASRDTLYSIQAFGLEGKLRLVFSHTRPHGLSQEDVVRMLNYPVSAELPYDAQHFDALQAGQPLTAFDPEALYARTVLEFSRYF